MQSTFRNTLALLTLLLSSTASLHAQAPVCTPNASADIVAFNTYSPPRRKAQPFSETIRNTSERQLADGNTLRGMSVVHHYRDSAGRIRNERIEECFPGKDGQVHVVLGISVYDSANHTSISWSVGRPGNKVAHIYHSSGASEPQLTPEETEERRAFDRLRVNVYQPPKTEELGKRTFFGIETTGTKSTTITPAGTWGNDGPIITTDESWAIRPGGAMLSIRQDPRFGKYTTEVIEFTPGEPDPSLFVPPSDYQIIEQKTESVVTPSTKKE